MTALLPCPFCGDLAWLHSSSGEFHDGAMAHRIECEGKCHAMTCWWHSTAEAIAAWNTRPSPARDEGAGTVEPVAWRMMMPSGDVLRIQHEPFHDGFARMMTADCGCTVEPLYAAPVSAPSAFPGEPGQAAKATSIDASAGAQ